MSSGRAAGQRQRRGRGAKPWPNPRSCAPAFRRTTRLVRCGTRWSIGTRALIARCTSADDVVGRYARSARRPGDRESSAVATASPGLAVPEGGLMIDLTPDERRARRPRPAARVRPGRLAAAEPRPARPSRHGLCHHGRQRLAHGVGGLTLGGGMGWLARQFGLACDNVASYTVVTADGEVMRASATSTPTCSGGCAAAAATSASSPSSSSGCT